MIEGHGRWNAIGLKRSQFFDQLFSSRAVSRPHQQSSQNGGRMGMPGSHRMRLFGGCQRLLQVALCSVVEGQKHRSLKGGWMHCGYSAKFSLRLSQTVGLMQANPQLETSSETERVFL